jgi:heme o synthase
MSSTPASLMTIYFELGKVRLSMLVLFTTFAGYLSAQGLSLDVMHMAATLIGTALAAVGANGLNQVLERDRDALMERTKNRPLPTGKIGPVHAAVSSGLTALLGCALLWWRVGPVPAVLALSTVVLYVGIYTPLKPVTTFNTLVGSLVGAIPPMIGWSAVTGGLERGALLLGLLLFIWQVPHFLSLAWLYREDYRRGGYQMMSLLDDGGDVNFRLMMIYAWVLLPLGMLMSLAGLAGSVFAVGSLIMGGFWLWLGIRCYHDRNPVNTRRVFLGSVMYLPLLLILMIVDRGDDPVGAGVSAPEPPAVVLNLDTETDQ